MEAESAFWIPFQYKQRYQSGGYNDYLSLCGYSLCFGVGVMAAKLRYICEMTKGMGKNFFEGGGSKEMLNGWYKEVAIVAMLQLLQLLQCCNKVYSTR